MRLHGVPDNATLEVVEEHLHHKVRWYGKKAVQTATEWCDGNTISSPYIATSGNNDWGTGGTDPAQLFGTADELIELGPGLVSGDFDLLHIIANTSDTTYKLRLVWGTGTLAEAITANQYSEIMYIRKSSDSVRIPRLIACPNIPFFIGGLPVQIWMVCWNATNDATISFFIGAHGYE
jgi:hypothetical protein